MLSVLFLLCLCCLRTSAHFPLGAPAMPPKRILFTGISGIGKTAVVKNFRQFLLKEWNVDDAQAVSAAPIVWPEQNINIGEFVGLPLDEQKSELALQYRIALSIADDHAADEGVRAILMPLHATFLHYDRIFSPLSWRSNDHGQNTSFLLSFVESFRPDYIVNLIDDCYYLQDRMRRSPAKLQIRLREIIKWREVETMISDHIANQTIPSSVSLQGASPFESSPLFAVRHNCESLYRYIFEPETPRVYASFLITEMRKRANPDRAESMARQVNLLIEELTRKFAVFNPLTIDEKPLGDIKLTGADPARNLVFSNQMRWQTYPSLQLSPHPIVDVFDVDRVDVEEVTKEHELDGRSIVDRQVEFRDFRLIDQSDCIVIYRPTNKLDRSKRYWGGGCYREFEHARDTFLRNPKFVIYIVTDEEDGSLTEAVGIPKGSAFQSEHPRIKVFRSAGLDNEDQQRAVIRKVVAQIERDAVELTHKRTYVNAAS